MPALLPGPLLPARIKKAVFKKRLVRQRLEAPHREGIGNARCREGGRIATAQEPFDGIRALISRNLGLSHRKHGPPKNWRAFFFFGRKKWQATKRAVLFAKSF